MIMKEKLGLSRIFLMILIIIIILISIAIFSAFKTSVSENFEEFVANFSKFSLAVDEAYDMKIASYSLKNENRSKSQIYYEISTGIALKANDSPVSIGSVASLGMVLPEALKGVEYYLVTTDNKALNWDNQNQFYDTKEKYYINNEGEAFFLPGYLVKENGEQRWYINETKYYVGEKKDALDVVDSNNTSADNSDMVIQPSEQMRLNKEGVKVLTSEEIDATRKCKFEKSEYKNGFKS